MPRLHFKGFFGSNDRFCIEQYLDGQYFTLVGALGIILYYSWTRSIKKMSKNPQNKLQHHF